jgi:HNH endonuclease
VITLEDITQAFKGDSGELALALHYSIWEGFHEDLAKGSTSNQVKPLMKQCASADHRLLKSDAEHWDRLVILPHAEKEWPEKIAILRNGWPGGAGKHRPVTRLAVLLWLERLYHPDLGDTTLTDLQDLFSMQPEEAARQAEYRRYCSGLLQGKVPGTFEETVSTRIRSARARNAVLYRDEYTCRNPRCTGQCDDVNDKGKPIVHVDHIRELGDSGPDDPRNMITLCPNCHAIKTLGRSRGQLTDKLSEIALQRHATLWGVDSGSTA